MIEHESDLWPERRWAIKWYQPTLDPSVPYGVWCFKSSQERDTWIAEMPGIRQAVGKRHPAVKALRQQWRQERLRFLDSVRAGGTIVGRIT